MDWVKYWKWFVHFHAGKHQISSTDYLNSMGAVEVKMLRQSLQKIILQGGIVSLFKFHSGSFFLTLCQLLSLPLTKLKP